MAAVGVAVEAAMPRPHRRGWDWVPGLGLGPGLGRGLGHLRLEAGAVAAGAEAAGAQAAAGMPAASAAAPQPMRAAGAVGLQQACPEAAAR